jgi:hypothetical protein
MLQIFQAWKQESTKPLPPNQSLSTNMEEEVSRQADQQQALDSNSNSNSSNLVR